jgi:hypothetical protein
MNFVISFIYIVRISEQLLSQNDIKKAVAISFETRAQHVKEVDNSITRVLFLCVTMFFSYLYVRCDLLIITFLNIAWVYVRQIYH